MDAGKPFAGDTVLKFVVGNQSPPPAQTVSHRKADGVASAAVMPRSGAQLIMGLSSSHGAILTAYT